MPPTPTMTTTGLETRSAMGRRLVMASLATLAALATVCLHPEAQAATALADAPVFSVGQAPGNVALVLSVEYPTVVSVAYTSRTYSAAGADYLGYFDPNKCYDYQSSPGDKPSAPNTTAASYFVPSGTAKAHICANKWSGHFLNWAAMQTIDAFRSVMTGGYRVIDQPGVTVLEKAWGSGQGGTTNFPDGSINAADIAGATPFGPLVNSGATSLQFRIQGLGNQMRFYVAAPAVTYGVTYYNFGGTCTSANFTTCVPITPIPSTVTDFSAVKSNASPYPPYVSASNFGARYSASIKVPTSGNYNFRVQADDGARLYLNNSPTPLLTTTAYNRTETTSTAVSLTAGDTLTIRLDYYQFGGGANISVFDWQLPNGTWFPLGNSVSNNQGANADYDGGAATVNTSYSLFVRAKVCDNSSVSGGVETNCVAYGQAGGQAYKPQGLIHDYSNKLRFSTFGYLNDSNIRRDGGVLRARQKFVGPTQPVPGAPAVPNVKGASVGQITGGEWDASTGVYVDNPDADDAKSTNLAFGTSIGNSGVANYLNKFGEITTGNFKTNDPVSELYYAAVRYFKNQGNVPAWTAMSGSSVSTYVDGFPVITAWDDPILYSCQRNFILGIGDVNTHADKNVPGNSNSTSEPALPPEVGNDASVNAVTATNIVGGLEGMGPSIGTTGPGGDANSYLMAGLAYDSHVKDIRPEKFKPANGSKAAGDASTIDTYWVDVQEFQKYANNNQFYLATKYGGFTVPSGYNYGDALPPSSWHNTTNTQGNNLQPDNYFSGARPDLMKAGLTAAFADIASKNKGSTTAFATALGQIGSSGNATYSSNYDTATWTSELTAGELSFNSNGDPVSTTRWTLAALLRSQIGTNTGWDYNRRVVTWNPTARTGVPFRASTLTSTQLNALNTPYGGGADSANYLNYLRGDQSNERDPTASNSAKPYRTRSQLLGDIVDSKIRVVGPPTFPYLDGSNPGYSDFKKEFASRPTVIYFGANDGMLHAIHGDLASASTTPSGPGGIELFAYIPSALFSGPSGTSTTDGLASIGNPSFVHHYMVNASPVQYDVDFSRTAGASASGASDWRSILIGGLGKGGKGYYAIDVTRSAELVAAATATSSSQADTANEQTVAGKVLWEFNATASVKLGYSYGDPIVAKTKKHGWVVVVPSGYNTSDGVGRLFILNAKTGALLDTLSTGVGSTANDAGLAQVNSFINDSTDGTVDSLYAGDLLGNVWRFDLTGTSGTYPAPTLIAQLTDANNVPQPVTTAPALSVDPVTRKRFVLVGTGRLLDTTDIASTQQQTFYAIVDGSDARFNLAADLPKAVTFPITRKDLFQNVSTDTVTFDSTTQIGWYEDVSDPSGSSGANSGWRVLKNPSTLAGSVAFSTTRPDLTNVCSPSGTSRLYGRALGSAATTLLTPNGIAGTSVVATPYYDYPDTITDQQFYSVNGNTKLVVGTAKGLDDPNLKPLPNQTLRRLNWRELRVVD